MSAESSPRKKEKRKEKEKKKEKGIAPSPCAVTLAKCRRHRGTLSCADRASEGEAQSHLSCARVGSVPSFGGGLKGQNISFFVITKGWGFVLARRDVAIENRRVAPTVGALMIVFPFWPARNRIPKRPSNSLAGPRNARGDFTPGQRTHA